MRTEQSTLLESTCSKHSILSIIISILIVGTFIGILLFLDVKKNRREEIKFNERRNQMLKRRDEFKKKAES